MLFTGGCAITLEPCVFCFFKLPPSDIPFLDVPIYALKESCMVLLPLMSKWDYSIFKMKGMGKCLVVEELHNTLYMLWIKNILPFPNQTILSIRSHTNRKNVKQRYSVGFTSCYFVN